MNGQKLEQVTGFKYQGATLCKDGTCSADVRIIIASAMAAAARLNRIWRCNTISFTSNSRPYNSFVTPIHLYAVKHGPCSLAMKKGPRLSKLNA